MTSLSLGYFGDARREQAGQFLLERLLDSGGQGISVRRLGEERAGEMCITRFLHNKAVTVREMTETDTARTAERCAGQPVIVIQDTTVVRSDGGGGLYAHVAIAVHAVTGALLGLVYVKFLTRTHGERKTRTSRPIRDKESFRWLEGAEAAKRVCARASSITVVADRESDIYEAFAFLPDGVDLLVRVAQDRTLDDKRSLFACTAARHRAGHTTVQVPSKPGQAARTATLGVRFLGVKIKRPRGVLRRTAPKTITATMVDLREVQQPLGLEPLHWRLLTTKQVTHLHEALEIADLYRRRWGIEQLFRTMKTQGFDIEALRTVGDAPRTKLVTATLIAALTIQQLLHARDAALAGEPLQPLTDLFPPEDHALLHRLNRKVEGATARQKNPWPRDSLVYATWICGRLGGWTGYYRQPGPVVLLRGWTRVQDYKNAMGLLRDQDV
jgi:hypothetical protein